MWTGSLINDLTGPGVVPAVGMGATMLGWTDRHAATIVAVSPSGREVTARRDIATRVDKNGMSEMQDYTFERDPNGHAITYTRRKDGRWVEKGSGMKEGRRLSIGRRDEYYDFSF